MMYSTIIVMVLLISGVCSSNSQAKSSSPVFDLFMKAFIRTFEIPISLDDKNAKFSLEIMLENDVFNLDDALRLFIQQYLVSLYNGRLHLLPDDWNTQYPAYGRVINEINNILDLLEKRTLNQISMKDIRPFIKALSPNAFVDLKRLLNMLEDKAKEEDLAKEDL